MRHALALIALSFLGAGGPALASTPTEPADNPANKEHWKLTLADVIKIGLHNDEITRVISLGAGGASFPPESSVIPPVGATYVVIGGNMTEGLPIAPITYVDEDSLLRFRAEVMAEVRSIETRYWGLFAQHVRLREAEKVVQAAEGLIKAEEAIVECRRCPDLADVAQARGRLEQLRLDLKARAADAADAERRLRDLLGLPADEGGPIVPAGAPSATDVTPDPQACANQMMELHPGIARQKRLVDRALLGLLVSRNQISAEAIGLKVVMSFGRSPLPTVRQAQYLLLKQRETLDQIVHDAACSLDQHMREADGCRRKHEAAVKARDVAAERLAAQRADFDEGRITLIRCLDALRESADAVSEEARSSAAYQTALAAVEEARGTLLESRKIYVVDPPKPRADRGGRG